MTSMSMNRRLQIDGPYGRTVERGPNGRGICRHCGVEVPVGRRTTCSDACATELLIRMRPAYAARLVFRRDRGICRVCGLDCEMLRRVYRRVREISWEDAHWFADQIGVRELRYGAVWEADHIVEVVRGGGECGLEGYQTLCKRCHKLKTAKFVSERAKERRLAKERANQPLFDAITSTP